jgi:uncharacterized protein
MSTHVTMSSWIEIVDTEGQIRSFLEAIEPMMGSSLITLEKFQVLRYGDRPS